MKKRNTKAGLSDRQAALAMTPVKNRHIEEIHLPDGEFQIRYPAISTGPRITAFLEKIGRTPKTRMKKIQLDGLGSQVWELIDNGRSVRGIIEHFAQAHHLPFREAEVAVTQFVRILGRRGLIGLK
jgi:hypothetical protein